MSFTVIGQLESEAEQHDRDEEQRQAELAALQHALEDLAERNYYLARHLLLKGLPWLTKQSTPCNSA